MKKSALFRRWSVLVALLGAAVLVPSAQATCTGQTFTKPFLGFSDLGSYTMVPGGNFETKAAGWTLVNGAKVAFGNEPFFVAGPGFSSLELPAGSSATSPPVCVSSAYPSSRMLAVTTRHVALSGATLKIETIGADGIVRPVGTVPVSLAWSATRRFAVSGAVGGSVRYRFTPTGGDSWRIDDVFVDPIMR